MAAFVLTDTPGVYSTMDATQTAAGIYALDGGVEISPGVYRFATANITVTVSLGARRWSGGLGSQRWAGSLT